MGIPFGEWIEEETSFVKSLGCNGYYWGCLLALPVGRKLCIDFSVPVPANFLTTLHSHLDDVTCSCYFWFSFKDERSV